MFLSPRSKILSAIKVGAIHLVSLQSHNEESKFLAIFPEDEFEQPQPWADPAILNAFGVEGLLKFRGVCSDDSSWCAEFDGFSGNFILHDLDIFKTDQAIQNIFFLIVSSLAQTFEHKNLAMFHGGLSPYSIIIGHDGNVKIWGYLLPRIADHQSVEVLKWMAPEQIRSDKFDHRADFFTVGLLMYEAIMGHHYYREGLKRSDDEFVKYSLQKKFIPTGSKFDPILEKLLELNPNKRYQKHYDLIRALAVLVLG